MNINIHVFNGGQSLASAAARTVCEQVQSTPEVALGLATGGSMDRLYEQLILMHTHGEVSFAKASAYLLDEYVGLPPGHPESYAAVIDQTFTSHVDFRVGSVHGPIGQSDNIEAECRRYDHVVTDAEIDVQLLGIGRNGHIAFNEPSSLADSRTRVVTLSESTRADNARFFNPGDEVPERAITQGIGTILQAKHLVLVVQGSNKADVLRAALTGDIASDVPASFLQTHDRVSVFADEEAARYL